MQLKLCKTNQVILILKKLKLPNKLVNMKIQFNIMIIIIDNKNKNLMILNILQLKWKLQKLIQKKYQLKLLNKKLTLIQNNSMNY